MDFVLHDEICPERSTNTNPITREKFTNTVRGVYWPRRPERMEEIDGKIDFPYSAGNVMFTCD
jgi:hypothetical protein